MSGPYAGYILGAYAVTAGALGYLVLESWLALRQAKARLLEIKHAVAKTQGEVS